jgi:hypothetical protein
VLESAPSTDNEGDVGIASAFGTTPIGTFEYTVRGVTIKVPTGCFFTHYIQGSGQFVERHTVGTDCVGPGYWWGGFCNYQFEIRYYDLSGREYASRSSGLHSACDYNTLFTFNPNQRYNVGKACAVLKVGGVEQARQCHNILAG